MRSPTVSTKLRQIAEQAKQYPERVFTTLAYLMDVEFLKEAFRKTRKGGATGIDKVTAAEYAANLDENLRDLLQRMRSGLYKAPPVLRKWLEKEDGSQRPIGVPTFEDKIAQRAVAMVLGAIYEEDFYDFSYGFRPGRRPHDALHELREQSMGMEIGWILDADISGFFDSIDHAQLREVLRKRVNDGEIVRLIGKWLQAGVLEEDILSYSDTGTPQGGVISPMLANIFLHTVLDEWFDQVVRPRMRGRCFMVRFADDFVIGFEREDDAKRVMAVVPKRFAKYGLRIHPDKTKLIPFQKPSSRQDKPDEPESFTFLGLTHFWAKSRRGYWVIKRKTASKRLKRAARAFWVWCRNNRHAPIQEQYRMLCSKLRGHYQYYGIRGNISSLEKLFHRVQRMWKYWLSRRSHKGYMNWDKFVKSLQYLPLPTPRIVHSI
jgi:group II intron reverse transcriptase/maturase